MYLYTCTHVTIHASKNTACFTCFRSVLEERLRYNASSLQRRIIGVERRLYPNEDIANGAAQTALDNE